MSEKPRVLFIINDRNSAPRRLHDWLLEAGLEIDIRIGASDPLPESLAGFSGMVLFGGGLMPDAFEKAPWLTQERQLTADAIAADFPTLGICLGGQIITQVAGGEVQAAYGTPERGSTQIFSTAAGREDALLKSIGESAPMMQNHEDVITKLPAGAVLLASSEVVENQAFRLGENVHALQFHPEASASVLPYWDAAELAKEGFNLAEMCAVADQNHEANTKASHALALAFADNVKRYAAAQ